MATQQVTIHLATDHAGLSHKDAVKTWLEQEGLVVIDHGAFVLDPLDDFTDTVVLAARAVSAEPEHSRGIIFGASGQGEAMIANRLPKVRATVFYGGDTSIITLSREHNDANVLSIGARFVDIDTTKKIIWDWLHANPILEEKYQRRNEKIDELTRDV